MCELSRHNEDTSIIDRLEDGTMSERGESRAVRQEFLYIRLAAVALSDCNFSIHFLNLVPFPFYPTTRLFPSLLLPFPRLIGTIVRFYATKSSSPLLLPLSSSFTSPSLTLSASFLPSSRTFASLHLSGVYPPPCTHPA